MRSIALFLLMTTTAVAQNNPNNWHLLTKSYGGKISLVKNLTEQECRYMADRALGYPATDTEKALEKRKQDAIREAVTKACSNPPKEAQDGDVAIVNYAYGKSAVCHKSDGKWFASSWSMGPGHPILPGDIDTAECFQ